MGLVRSIAAGLRPGAAAAAAAGEEARPIDGDLGIVRRVQTGDVAAFDLLVTKYRERLFGVLYNLTGNREDAADLAQDAFIKAFRSIQSFQGGSAFYTWLYRIAVNGALTQMKRRRLRQIFSFESLDEGEADRVLLEALAAQMGSDRAAALRELQEKLNEALHKLSPKHRTVVVLHEIEGLPLEEVAEVLGCSSGTVRSRLHYAKQLLQGYLQDYLR